MLAHRLLVSCAIFQLVEYPNFDVRKIEIVRESSLAKHQGKPSLVQQSVSHFLVAKILDKGLAEDEELSTATRCTTIPEP